MKQDSNSSKRIGVLTYHRTVNFGSQLQAYALYKTVKDMGASCEIIDYRNNIIEKREFMKKIYQCRSLSELKSYVLYYRCRKKRERSFDCFLHEHMQVSDCVYDRSNIDKIQNQYDCLLVGSDLTWDFSINGHDKTYMLDFADENIQKIAYASSVGGLWPKQDSREVYALLDRFHAIGVREREIQENLSRNLNKDIDFVCDPTMLVDAQAWSDLAGERMIKAPYVLCYMTSADDRTYVDALKYGQDNNLPVYVISHGWTPASLRPIRPSGVEQFLSLILYADAVFTASYHGLLFSLYFEKEFYYYNRGWKSRMQSIANLLDIGYREYYNKDSKKLDYVNIREHIEIFRNESLRTLTRYIKS